MQIAGLIPFHTLTESPQPFRGRSMREVLARGCFRNHLNGRTIPLTVDHNDARELGNTRCGLTVWESPEGLRFRLDSTTTARHPTIITAIRRGDITGASFRFLALDYEERRHHGLGEDVRTILEAELREITLMLTKRPAYNASRVTVEPSSQRRHFTMYHDPITARQRATSEGASVALRTAPQWVRDRIEAQDKADADKARRVPHSVSHQHNRNRLRIAEATC
ncbi:HK97 family phage prohead protease [Thiohalobacter thiocyanaticus]|nr:HK97 family phage prohead protease [Thiohalobacter thiocyanaticus]